ncbi:NAD-dependent epimerase/dehydratase family protein [Aureimonas sp. ME7]|uniref:NAD-dependent epimerase/dehydratase family protein n=1 Tax=Aureimonas sp. ME7 TaxID=2744252 RepID=UPI0015F5355B|nr:NAD-dependent epimerase/dehydratase family protein [Aureimonas sp. ME7]
MDDLVLVTGASGFIAKHIVLRLLQEGWRVRGTVRGQERADEVRSVVEVHGGDSSRLEFAFADLSSGEGWFQAAGGCRYLVHTASPFPLIPPCDADGLVSLAKRGTEYVLRAAARAGTERAVVTSSVAAVLYGHPAGRASSFAEADWTNTKARAVSSYARSKTLAEKAAWDVARETGLSLSTINPGLVFGPVLDKRLGTSAELVALLLRGRVPALPDIAFPTVDVRDVATAHVRALTVPVTGRRFLLAAPDELTLPGVAAALSEAYPDRRAKLPRHRIPASLLRMVGRFSPGVAMLADDIGRAKTVDTTPARELLGLDFIPARTAALDLAESLLRNGCV